MRKEVSRTKIKKSGKISHKNLEHNLQEDSHVEKTRKLEVLQKKKKTEFLREMELSKT